MEKETDMKIDNHLGAATGWLQRGLTQGQSNQPAMGFGSSCVPKTQ